jgi:hypothetical protein
MRWCTLIDRWCQIAKGCACTCRSG